MSAAVPFAVAVAVGPGDREIDRLIDLADSLSAFERGPGWFVMIDDAAESRNLETRVKLPDGIKPVAVHHPRHHAGGVATPTFKIGKGICSAVLLSLKWVQANTDARFVLKVDTDSLIIAPFVEKLAALFEHSPTLGMAGAYQQTPNGTERDWSHHRETLLRLFRLPSFDLRHPIASLRSRHGWRSSPGSGAFERAMVNPEFEPGEHCMGGGYAVSATLLDRMFAAGYFDDVMAWSNVDLPEDVTVGIHVRAVGMTFADCVAPGEVFGVRYRGLPFSPEELAAKGYAVIHAVKNDKQFDEASVRKFFADRRADASAPMSY